MAPMPKDRLSMATPYLKRAQDDVYGDQEDEKNEKVENEGPFDFWQCKEKQERFENWFRESPIRPKGIDTCFSGQEIVDGSILLEVFEVCPISYSKSKRKLNINGRITISGSYGKSDIFARTLENPEKVYSRDKLTLTGPTIASVAHDRIYIKFDIKDGKRHASEGDFSWSSMSFGRQFKYDHPMFIRLDGKKGFAFDVRYAIFHTANLIAVDIQIPKINDSQNILVQSVDASIQTSRCSFPKTTLFNSNRSYVGVNLEGGELPLSKSLIACPGGGALRLYLRFLNCKNGIVTKEMVKFVPKCFGPEKMEVNTKYGLIIVNFTVYPVDVHPPTLESAKYKFWRLFWPETFAKWN